MDKWITVKGVYPYRRVALGKGKEGIPILMYHSISGDEESEAGDYFKVCTPVRMFAEQMEWLYRNGFETLDMSEWGNTSNPAKRRAVAITFDDGFRDNHDQALSVLERFGFRATVYLPSAFIRTPRRKFNGRECLEWSEVNEMRLRGVRFGSHTANHPILRKLPWSGIEDELRESKDSLESQLQEEICAFAYPYAFPQEDKRYVKKLSDCLRKSGYKSCVTTCIGRNSPDSEAYCLKRLPINSRDDLRLFRAKVEGAYDWMGVVQRWFRRVRYGMRDSRWERTGE